MIWLPASLLAGLFQAWRTAIQQGLRHELSVSGAGLVRYLYGAPIAFALVSIWLWLRNLNLPPLDLTYVTLVAGAGLAQILGTNLLITAFRFRNFVVGTAFSKTEAVQVAIFAFLILGERLSPLAIVAVVIGLAGVLTLTLAGRNLSRRDMLTAIGQPAALCGMASGTFFAITGVIVKQATIHLAMTDQIAAALITLSLMMVLQTLMHGSYVFFTQRATYGKIFASWRTSSQVGLLAALGSGSWFIGFAMAPVALVRLIGQIEVLFTLGFARFYLKEQTKPYEFVGLLMVALSVVLALIAGLGLEHA